MQSIVSDMIRDNFLLSITITLAVYSVVCKVLSKVKSPLLTPLPIAVIIIAVILNILKIPLEEYNKGTSFITAMLSPMTVVLALPIYKNIEVIKKNFHIIVISISIGITLACVLSFVLAKIFNFNDRLMVSMLTKSVTTPISLALTDKMGGIRSLSILAVSISGMTGAAFGPAICKILRIKSPIAIGLGIGNASHAVGTSAAFELGEEHGALSSLAIGVAGIISVFLIPILYKILTFIWS